MQRNNLIMAVAQAARDCGLCFHIGYEYQLNEALKEMPALWLSNLETTKQEGVNEGLKTYAVKLAIIYMPERNTAADPESIWKEMEAKATGICAAIAEAECVKSTSGVEITAAKSSITNRREISMAVKMNVQMQFLNTKN